MPELRDAPARSDSELLGAAFNPALQNENISAPPTQADQERRPRQATRKPSPGLAARLKALGFGKENTKSTSISPSAERVGRIPENQIRELDHIHRSRSAQPLDIPRKGRAWSGGSKGQLTPQLTGVSETAAEGSWALDVSQLLSAASSNMTTPEPTEIDSNKYRLPDHTNGNGTKVMWETKKAHIHRDVPPEEPEEIPPPPIAKDTPPGGTTPGEFSGDASVYFNPFGLQRTGSIYTLSRVSFANQLAQLTSLQLPDAESLSTKVSAITTSKAASKALMGAAEQIRSWISKASEVVAGLDGEDDVEWAAAGGREGLEEVDNAITRFEELINVYVSSIESLQGRPDISSVPSDELQKVVLQVESIMSEWEKIRRTLRDVKKSVEIAMEWEELWNTVLGDIGNEMDILARLVFEMEEKRHKSLLAEVGGDSVDFNELQTIVEETPPKAKMHANRLSMVAFPLSPSSPSTTQAQDDSSLLALFARMQPLRASLDFLPMRLSTFHTRAEDIFPTACEELDSRRDGLEESWASLEKDAESLRRELGEDRWVLVFRGAGRQAQKMYESVDRSLIKLREAVDSGQSLNNPAAMGKKIESYEAKKMHYGPAIERVLSIIEKGVKDRLTVNGEILRLHSDMQQKWATLKDKMHELDTSLTDFEADKKEQQLRDSISSMVSNDRSTVGSNDTPGSSPASSVVMTGVSRELDPSTPGRNAKRKSHLPTPGQNRTLGAPSANQSRKGLTPRISSGYGAPPGGHSPRQNSSTPTGNRLPRPTGSGNSLDSRPKWNASVNTQGTLIGHNYKPLSLTTPSPHAKTPSLSASDSKIPLRSSLLREKTASPTPDKTPSRSTNSRAGFRDLSSPGPYAQQTLAKSSPPQSRHLSTRASMGAMNPNRRSSLQPHSSDPTALGSSPLSRSTGNNRRVSLLPQPRGRQDSGRESPQAIAAAASAMRRGSSVTSSDSKGSGKPPFRV